MIKRGTVTLLTLFVALGLPMYAGAQEAAAARLAADPGSAAAGKKLYRRKCAMCHGTRGQGDGPVSRYVFPRPRDLSLGIFKIHSTPTGGLPTDLDLFETLTRGMPGTTMPGWSNLTETERWQLVAYIKTLSPGIWTDEDFDRRGMGDAAKVTDDEELRNTVAVQVRSEHQPRRFRERSKEWRTEWRSINSIVYKDLSRSTVCGQIQVPGTVAVVVRTHRHLARKPSGVNERIIGDKGWLQLASTYVVAVDRIRNIVAGEEFTPGSN